MNIDDTTNTAPVEVIDAIDTTEVVEQSKVELTVHQVLDMVNNPARMEDESFEDYRKRRTLSKKFIKSYLKGRVVWDPFILKQLMNIKTGVSFNDKNVRMVSNIVEKYKEFENEKYRESGNSPE
jgi:hypothetical protein